MTYTNLLLLTSLTSTYFPYFSKPSKEVSSKNNQTFDFKNIMVCEVSEVSETAKYVGKVNYEKNFIMNQQEEIIQKIKKHNDCNGGWDKVYQYLNDTYAWLQKIPVGRIYTIADMYPAANDADLFTNILKLYICETNTTIRFLRNDFKQFRKNKSPSLQVEE